MEGFYHGADYLTEQFRSAQPAHKVCRAGEARWVYYTLPNWTTTGPGRLYEEGTAVRNWLVVQLGYWLVQASAVVQAGSLAGEYTVLYFKYDIIVH